MKGFLGLSNIKSQTQKVMKKGKAAGRWLFIKHQTHIMPVCSEFGSPLKPAKTLANSYKPNCLCETSDFKVAFRSPFALFWFWFWLVVVVDSHIHVTF
jgi:hypothetical protein